MQMRRFVLPAMLGLSLFGAQSAMATNYFVAAPGSDNTSIGGPCDAAKPCTLTAALDSMHAGGSDFNDVTVPPGTYLVDVNKGPLLISKQVTIHGDPAQARPVIAFLGDNPQVTAGLQVTRGTVLRHLELTSALHGPVGGTVILFDSFIEDSIVHATTPFTSAVFALDGSAIRNSVLRMDGAGINGLSATRDPDDNSRNVTELRNVTISGAANSGVGVTARCGNGSRGGVVNLINTIVQSAGTQLFADGAGCDFGYLPEVNATSSSFDPARQDVTAGGIYHDGGSNVGPATLAADGIHEVAGSPTIDAGKVDAPSAIDIDGSPRIQGSAVDIGADEFVPPTVAPTPPATTPASNPFVSPIAPVILKTPVYPPGVSGLTAKGTKSTSKTPPTIHFTLSSASRIPFKVSALVSGRRRKGKCVSPAAKKGEKCTVVRSIFSGTISAAKGTNTVGLLTSGSTQLSPGTYRVTLSPAGFSARSATFQVTSGAKKKATKKKK